MGSALSFAAVPSLEKLPQKAIDTLDTERDDVKVVLYSNNTWKYYHPELDDKLGVHDVYQEHWDNSQVFAYKSVALKDLPDVVELKLIDDLADFRCPLQGKVYSKYGPRGSRNHNGIDIPLKTGEPIFSAFEGKVRYAKYNWGGFGYLVIVRHSNGLETWHAHLSRLNVTENSFVKAGEVIGFGGSTGRSSGPHLHFEMRYYDQTFDPEYLIDFASGQLKYTTFELEKSFFNINSRATDQLEDHDEFYDKIASGDNTSDEILERIAQAQKPGQSVSQGGTVVYHTVRSGDMLGRIAKKYGVTVGQICRLNNIKTNSVIKVGQRLRIR